MSESPKSTPPPAGIFKYAERELTLLERARWGTCPHCQAKPGVACEYGNGDSKSIWACFAKIDVGLCESAHLDRFLAAPARVAIRMHSEGPGVVTP